MPTVEAWPELEALLHWRADTEGIIEVWCSPWLRAECDGRVLVRQNLARSLWWRSLASILGEDVVFQDLHSRILVTRPITAMQPRSEYPAHSRLAEHVAQQCAATGYQPRSLALELLAQLLEPNPAKRITAQRALQHPYFQQVPRVDHRALLYI